MAHTIVTLKKRVVMYNRNSLNHEEIADEVLCLLKKIYIVL